MFYRTQPEQSHDIEGRPRCVANVIGTARQKRVHMAHPVGSTSTPTAGLTEAMAST